MLLSFYFHVHMSVRPLYQFANWVPMTHLEDFLCFSYKEHHYFTTPLSQLRTPLGRVESSLSLINPLLEHAQEAQIFNNWKSIIIFSTLKTITFSLSWRLLSSALKSLTSFAQEDSFLQHSTQNIIIFGVLKIIILFSVAKESQLFQHAQADLAR